MKYLVGKTENLMLINMFGGGCSVYVPPCSPQCTLYCMSNEVISSTVWHKFH